MYHFDIFVNWNEAPTYYMLIKACAFIQEYTIHVHFMKLVVTVSCTCKRSISSSILSMAQGKYYNKNLYVIDFLTEVHFISSCSQ